MRRLSLPALLITLLLLPSCTSNKLDVDVSAIEIKDFEVLRLERDLFSMSPDSLDVQTEKMLTRYGNFYVSFVTRIINDGGIKDSSYNDNLKRFIADKDMREVYKECEKVHSDLSDFKEQLKDVFAHYKYYFPVKELPKTITYMSGFNYSVSYTDNAVGVGLEMHLGSNNKFYQMIQFPQYKTMTMTKDYLAIDYVKGWASAMYEPAKGKEDFLHQVVHAGKILYFMDAMMPLVADTMKIGYTQKQLEWCELNEYNMWAYFIQNKLLYETDNTTIQKFTGEGPFTAAFNKEAPARVGQWIGWQMVRAYMNRENAPTLEQLMNEKDAQKIMTASKYKPKKK